MYIKPLLSACEDLQSRIYSILELGGLRTRRKRYPDGSYAEETLYLIFRYLAWMLAAERHGPSLTVTGLRLVATTDHAMGLPVLPAFPSCVHAVAITPAQ